MSEVKNPKITVPNENPNLDAELKIFGPDGRPLSVKPEGQQFWRRFRSELGALLNDAEYDFMKRYGLKDKKTLELIFSQHPGQALDPTEPRRTNRIFYFACLPHLLEPISKTRNPDQAARRLIKYANEIDEKYQAGIYVLLKDNPKAVCALSELSEDDEKAFSNFTHTLVSNPDFFKVKRTKTAVDTLKGKQTI
jgi:glutamine synthetase adenylyltransferase